VLYVCTTVNLLLMLWYTAWVSYMNKDSPLRQTHIAMHTTSKLFKINYKAV